MTNFAKFLSVNGLKRKDIAFFLGVSGAFITQISSGSRPLPDDKLALIMENAYNWDTSMLTSQEALPDVSPAENAGAYEMLINHLKQEIKDKDALITELRKEIWSLQQELDLAGKGETARGADGSFVADAV